MFLTNTMPTGAILPLLVKKIDGKRKETNMRIALLALGLAMLAALFVPPCGDDDPTPPCESQEGCVPTPDSGANPQADAGTTPTDATTDPCAPYVGHTDGWSCSMGGGHPFRCDFTLQEWEGICYICCEDGFGCEAPSQMATTSEFTCSDADTICWQ